MSIQQNVNQLLTLGTAAAGTFIRDIEAEKLETAKGKFGLTLKEERGREKDAAIELGKEAIEKGQMTEKEYKDYLKGVEEQGKTKEDIMKDLYQQTLLKNKPYALSQRKTAKSIEAQRKGLSNTFTPMGTEEWRNLAAAEKAELTPPKLKGNEKMKQEITNKLDQQRKFKELLATVSPQEALAYELIYGKREDKE